jgi:RNA polymerase sigma-70 factor (ECF subfamily)
VDDPDAPLVRRAAKGDRWAFEQLVERHQHRLFTLAARLLGSPHDAADAVQDALIKAWLALPSFREHARFSTWIYRITLNCVSDVRARGRRTEPAEETDVADPSDEFARAELSSELQRALNALEEEYRAAVVLYDVLGCSYAEIAELTGVAEGTVKSRIFRGRTRLAELLGTAAGRTESNPW